MRTLARWCFRHRYIVVVVWIAALIGMNALHGAVGSAYSDNFKLPHTDSFDAVKLLQRSAPAISGETDQVVIATNTGKITDPAVRTRVNALLLKLKSIPHVSVIASPYAPGNARQIAPDGRIAYANVTWDTQSNKIQKPRAKQFVDTVTSAAGGGVQFQVEGQTAQQARSDNGASGTFFGFIAAAVVLFIVFGSFLAMTLPLLTAGVSLGTGIAVIGLLSHAINMASFANELALLIGLGVGVDYALFIVTRYRQGLLRGLHREDAAVESLDTSGRAVLFAGVIVCIAMLGMFALGVSFLYGVAVAASVAVAFTVLAALTLLPALLGIFGRLILRRRERRALADSNWRDSDESAAWARWTGWMQQRPAVFAIAATLLMLVIAIPFLSMRLGSADAGSDPTNTTSRKAYDLLAEGFGPGYNGPLQLVAQVSTPAQKVAFLRTVQAVSSTPGVVSHTTPVFIPARNGHAAVAIANVIPKWSPQAAQTADLLHHVRGTVVPAAEGGSGLHVLVGGQTAIFDDFAKVLSAKLPLFIGIVVLLSFLLLMTVFRSVAVPLTAAVMNMLSTGAALGIVTAIFQKGWGASLFGVDSTGPIEAFLPVLVFPIVFGLSMDYEVFLVSRIYEEWHRRGDNTEAVKHGLAVTGRTITAAAAIMVLVFGAFVLGGDRVIKLFGIGLASAVLLDAVIVRSVIVPALMMLLGERNWKLPRVLDRVLPHLNVEGESVRSDAPPERRRRGPEPEPEPEPASA
jgi:putative drug exporter of the RND superfamily